MHLILTCRPCQKQYKLWYSLAPKHGEMVYGRTRKGVHRLMGRHLLSKEDRVKPASQRKWIQIIIQNHLSGREGWKNFFLLQEMLRWAWTLLGRQVPTRSLARNQGSSMLHTPQWCCLGLSNSSLRELLLSFPKEDTTFLHLLGYQVTGVPGWCSPECDRDLPGEAAERDLLSKAVEVPLGPGEGWRKMPLSWS